jgi:hypothetical protein
VPIATAPTGRRHHVGRTWFSCELAYVLVITVIASTAMSSESRRPLVVVATVLALPCGAAALVGLYALTGLFNWMAAGFSTYSWSQSTGGCSPDGHCWSRTWGTPVGANGLGFDACVVALYTAAAIVNVLIVRQLVRGRREPVSEAPPGRPPTG